MARVTSQGQCALCKGTFAKAAMARHLAKCLASQESATAVAAKGATGKKQWFHLVVQGKGDPYYWLHLGVPATATLADLDAFLRHIWLECCGHLSAFTIGGTHYNVAPDPEAMFWAGAEDESMNARVDKIFRPDLKFSYEYDFGSTTALDLKVVAERTGATGKPHDIRLLARNDPPPITCGKCGAPATMVNTEEAWEPTGWLCDKCGRKECDPEMCLPVVNSPRVGVCGYTGE